MRVRLAFAALFSTALMGGCGSNGQGAERLTKAEYQDAIRDVLRTAQPADRLFFHLVANDLPQEECATQLREFQADLQRVLSQVRALSPPEDVADLQQQFLDGAQDSVSQVGKAVTRVEHGDLSCGEQLNRAIYGLPSTERAERALSGIESKGYVIFGE